jgi:hypothetical protein
VLYYDLYHPPIDVEQGLGVTLTSLEDLLR